MFSAFCNCLYKSNSPLSRAFHVGKQFANPSTEDIVFRAICVNLRQRKWKILEQMAPSLTNSLVNRVVSEFRKSPKLALEFYTWVGENNRFSHSLESSCAIVHLLVNWRRFDDALLLMGNLMSANSVSPLEFLEGLLDSYEICKATPAVFDALVRACTQIGATEGAYDVIQKLKVKGHSVSIHAWNNFLSHLVKLNEIIRFWKLYKEMVSCGYVENVNTFNLLICALCKECKLEEALSLYYRMLKSGIWPNVVCFNMIINEACQVGDLEFALKLFRKMGVMSGDSVLPNSVTHNCIINGFCKLGRVEFAEEIRYAMIKAGIDCNVRTYATLIDGYARGGSSEEALRLCDEMVKRGLMPNTVVYNSTIHWLFAEGDVEGALFVLSDMIDKHICPDQFTYSILTKGLCRNGCVKQAFKLHNQVLEEHMVGDAYSYNILINYLCKCNNLAAAKQLLSSMIVLGLIPDIITYGTLIDGYCKGGNIEGAVQVYENMKKVEKKPNLVIYNSIINGLCKDASLDAAKSLLEASQRIGLLDAITYNTLINGCFINGEGQPELISGSQIDFLVEGKLRSEKEHEDVDKGSPEWVTAQLMMLVDIPVSSLALQSLMEASSGLPEHEWEVGWSLAPYNNSSQPLMGVVKTSIESNKISLMESHRPFAMEESSNLSLMSKSTSRVAILGVSSYLKDLPNIALTPLNKRGDLLLAVGSPFGVLSPMHFFNSVSMGSVANCYPPRSTTRSLLMADIRCLPGMEGGPVFGEHAHFVGILIRPLRQKCGAEIQLVIPWEAIATACSDLLLKEPQNAEKEIHINKGNLNALGNSLLFNSHILNGACCYKYEHVDSRCRSPLPIQKALASVCLITIDDGVWASGVLLNDRGLILTNAHLLEPWRFGKTTVSGWRNGVSFQPEDSASSGHTGVDQYQKSQTLPPKMPKIVDSSVDEHRAYKLSSFSRGHRKIRVRLDHLDPWIWCDAKIVYVCKGPLDVSLLQLGYIPDQLCPIDADFGQPSLGSAAYVIGHGLFGPRCGLSPSVSSGVVAKVVKANLPSYGQSTLQRNSAYPVMLETTAAVHPGGSGGAVVNLDGHMIGLVTSNARHGGGTVIPHLNFSIPCAVLRPIFEFARDMQEVSLLRKLDEPNKHLASVWALMPPLSPKQGPSLPDLPQAALEENIEGKGSRFAKFIAERREVLKHSTQVGNAERVSGEIFRSKL